MLDDLDLSGITDERARELIVGLLKLIETLTADLHTAPPAHRSFLGAK